MKRLISISASIALAGAFLVPAASVATAAEGDLIGVTGIGINYDVTQTLLKSNVYANTVGRGGGSVIVEPGKLSLELAVSRVKKGKISHRGGLFLSHSGRLGWRTVVVSNVIVDVGKGTIKGRVYATDTDLGTATIFTLSKVKTSKVSSKYTVKLAPGAADLLNSSLGVDVFSDGMRVGSGKTVIVDD